MAMHPQKDQLTRSVWGSFHRRFLLSPHASRRYPGLVRLPQLKEFAADVFVRVRVENNADWLWQDLECQPVQQPDYYSFQEVGPLLLRRMAVVSMEELRPLLSLQNRGTSQERRVLSFELFVRLLDNVYGHSRIVGRIGATTDGAEEAWQSIEGKVGDKIGERELVEWVGLVDFGERDSCQQ